MLMAIFKIASGLGILLAIVIALLNDRNGERQKRNDKKDNLQTFEAQYKLTAILSCNCPSKEVRDKYFKAKGLIIESTSEFCSDCPGEAKSMLRDAAFIVNDIDEFGRNLAILIDIAIDHSYSCNDCNESSLHKMLWDCARLITMKFENKKTEKKKKKKKR